MPCQAVALWPVRTDTPADGAGLAGYLGGEVAALLGEHGSWSGFMTWVPGEALLIKFWETVEKFGTGLLSPAQIRREGKARAEVRRYEMLRDAQTKRDVEDLLAGRRTIDAQGKLLPASERASPQHLPPPEDSQKLASQGPASAAPVRSGEEKSVSNETAGFTQW